MTRPPTPSQTVGPFFAVELCWPDGPYVVPEGTPGALRLSGRLLDGAGDPVPDALVETWQADPDGRFGHGFRGFGRCPTDAEGRFWVLTVKPGPVPHPGGGLQAPHVDLSIFARGLLRQAVTRVYFADEPAANAADPVLAAQPDPARATLLAAPVAGGYHLDIHLQGEHAVSLRPEGSLFGAFSPAGGSPRGRRPSFLQAPRLRGRLARRRPGLSAPPAPRGDRGPVPGDRFARRAGARAAGAGTRWCRVSQLARRPTWVAGHVTRGDEPDVLTPRPWGRPAPRTAASTTGGAADAGADWPRPPRHPVAGRTLLHHAVPVTFGLRRPVAGRLD